jgi:uncharacterized protein (TIGR02996 family)
MHTSFLDAIRAEPDDLTHRLVYADWLEENGATEVDRVRAELIRVQIAREAADPDGDDYWHLRARERFLLNGWHEDLAGELTTVAQAYRFQGGFVEWAAVAPAVIVSSGARLAALAPLRSLAIVGTGVPQLPPELRGLTGLDLRGVTDPGSAHARLFWPPWNGLPRLRRLDLSPVLVELYRHALARLPALDHFGVGTSEPSSSLPPGPHSSELDRLVLNGPVPAGARSLALSGMALHHILAGLHESPWLKDLTDLRVNDRGCDPTLVTRLSQRGRASALRMFGKMTTPQVPDDPVPLPGPGLRQLRELHLNVERYNWEFDPAPFLRDLECRELRVLANHGALEEGEHWSILLEWHCWPRLHTLELPCANRPATEAVLAGPYPRQVRRLELPFLPEDGLPGGEPLPLVELRLSSDIATRVRDIARSEVLVNLASLEIGHAGLRQSADVAGLLDRDRFPRLLTVELHGVKVSEPWLSRLRERFGRGLRLFPRPTRQPGLDLVHGG